MKRSAFTLVELLVVISVIAILAGLILGALHAARQSARESKTKATITKLHNVVMERYESYRTRRVPLKLPPNTPPKEAARLRLNAIRDLMRMEMPERRQDILSLSMTGIPEPSTHHSLRMWLAEMETRQAFRAYKHVEAEVFYAWLVIADPETREKFADNEVADTDNDRALEFVDGWGRPIYFLRWPVLFSDSDVQSADPVSDHDPFDSRRLQPEAFRVVPLVYSPGPDGIYDIDVRPGIDYGASATVDPYRWPVGKPIGNGGHYDNIHNHRLAP